MEFLNYVLDHWFTQMYEYWPSDFVVWLLKPSIISQIWSLISIIITKPNWIWEHFATGVGIICTLTNIEIGRMEDGININNFYTEGI